MKTAQFNNLLVKRDKLSRSYVDIEGNLVLYETQTEKFIKQTKWLIAEMPSIGLFMIIGLFFIQLYIVFGGIYYHSNHQLTESEFKTYTFLFLFIGFSIGGFIKLAWLFMNERNEAAQVNATNFTD